MTATSLDEDILVLLDFEPEHACESISGCSEKAVWVVRRTCCMFEQLLCDKHKTKHQAALETADIMYSQGVQFSCGCCHSTTGSPKDITKFFPLEG